MRILDMRKMLVIFGRGICAEIGPFGNVAIFFNN
jgi:hypothetical protein